MKKVVIMILALAFILPFSAGAESKDVKKALKKELKTKLKEYKKGGWEILGSRTLEYSLAAHYDKLNELGEDAYDVEGISAATKSKNVGKQSAINSAVITYAQHAGSTLQGRVVADLAANGVEPSAEFDNFYAAYERLVEKEIRGELEPSYSVIKDNGNGTYEVRTYFIVSEKAASRARQRALEGALKDSEAAQKIGDKISGFVRQGFDK